MLNDHGDLCGDCLLRPPVFARNLSYGLYEGGLRDLILLYKYADLQPLSRLLGNLLSKLYQDNVGGVKFDCILTVPPDPGRKREFDHLALLGKVMARQTGIPFVRHVLVKRRTTEPQSTLPSGRRRRNLDKAFGLKRPHRVAGKNILLIDDVFTTGTTVTRCAELLIPLEATVTVLTLARSV
jgi:ComF family protein